MKPWIGVGEQIVFDISVYRPDSNAQGISYLSDDEAVATVDRFRTITAISEGVVTITTDPYGDVPNGYYTINVAPVKSGTYCVKSKQTKKFMDIEGPSAEANAKIHQWQYYGHSSQQWEFELLSDGYYTIKSQHSGLYLSLVNPNGVSTVTQLPYSGGDNQKWQITTSPLYGSYKITSKSDNGSNNCLALQNNSSEDNGVEICYRPYNMLPSYYEEWYIMQGNQSVLGICVMYDEAYSLADDFEERLAKNLYDIRINLGGFGIYVCFTQAVGFESCADKYCTASYDETCACPGIISCEYHHTNASRILADVPGYLNNTMMSLAYIGRKVCKAYANNTEYSIYGMAYINGTKAIVMSASYDESPTSIHEIGHWYGIEDHYGIGCKTTDEMISAYPQMGYNRNCVYGEYSAYVESNTLCDGCMSILNNNKNRYDQ